MPTGGLPPLTALHPPGGPGVDPRRRAGRSRRRGDVRAARNLSSRGGSADRPDPRPTDRRRGHPAAADGALAARAERERDLHDHLLRRDGFRPARGHPSVPGALRVRGAVRGPAGCDLHQRRRLPARRGLRGTARRPEPGFALLRVQANDADPGSAVPPRGHPLVRGPLRPGRADLGHVDEEVPRSGPPRTGPELRSQDADSRAAVQRRMQQCGDRIDGVHRLRPRGLRRALGDDAVRRRQPDATADDLAGALQRFRIRGRRLRLPPAARA